MPIPTNVRSARQVALLMAAQSALGTPITAFAAAPVLWTRSSEVPVSPEKSIDFWMSEPVAPAPIERFNIGDRPAGRTVISLTPDSLELLLRSNWGPKAGNDFTLKTQVAEWFTLAWVEHAAAGDIGKVIRIVDTWFHRLTMRASFPRGILAGSAAFLGRRILTDDKGSGGLTFPGSWSPGRNPFTINDAAFVRDPSGANIQIRLRELEVLFDQRAAPHEWDMGDLSYRVLKAGPADIGVWFRAEVSDQAWAVISDSRAGTKRQFRFTATAQAPAKTLTITLNEVDFTFDEIGHDGKDMREIRGSGRAHLSGGVPATVSIA